MRVQILDEAVCISHHPNTPGKGMHPTNLLPSLIIKMPTRHWCWVGNVKLIARSLEALPLTYLAGLNFLVPEILQNKKAEGIKHFFVTACRSLDLCEHLTTSKWLHVKSGKWAGWINLSLCLRVNNRTDWAL